MPQQIRVSRELDVTGATVLGLGNWGTGKVLYVDNTTGADGYEGTNPNYPKKTIQSAITACTNWDNDFIFVMRKATSDFTTTTPILMNKHTVHLIGLANMNPQGSLVRLVHTNDTDNVLEFPLDTGYHCEVAGFGFGGGTTAKGGIGMPDSGATGLGAWIHHCNFGGILTKGTPDFGIHNDDLGSQLFQWTIEDCSFYGSGGNGNGLISVDGIKIDHVFGASADSHLLIRNNIFINIPGVAINIDGVKGGMIINNSIKLDEDGAAGITLGSSCRGCWVSWNDCNFGSQDVSPSTNSGYTDSASNDDNTWSSNWAGGVVAYPV